MCWRCWLTDADTTLRRLCICGSVRTRVYFQAVCFWVTLSDFGTVCHCSFWPSPKCLQTFFSTPLMRFGSFDWAWPELGKWLWATHTLHIDLQRIRTFPSQYARCSPMFTVLSITTRRWSYPLSERVAAEGLRRHSFALTIEGLTAVIVQNESSFHFRRCNLVPKPLLGSFLVTWSTAPKATDAQLLYWRERKQRTKLWLLTAVGL